MTTAHYPPPVDQLLELGRPQAFSVQGWINYPVRFGLTLDHVPDLVRLIADWNADGEDEENPAVYAPIHAWRSLGQLRAETAIAALIDLVSLSDDVPDDWTSEELPEVLGLIGSATMPALTALIADPNQGMWLKVTASRAFVPLARHYPDQRLPAIAALSTALEGFADNDPELNGFLVCYLLDLAAVEAAPTMERAFAAQAVDLDFAGDWDAVQVVLGLKERPAEPPQRSLLDLPGASLVSWAESGGAASKAGSKSKARAKNKLAKQSRQKNRKKRK